jgi:polyferredoxin
VRRKGRSSFPASLAAGLTVVFILALARTNAPYTILLADRFIPGAGWIEIPALALYAALLTAKFLAVRDVSRLRLGVWLAFSVVFFVQFILGIAGEERLLMTGRLHLPVPAVIIAGPLYRGQRFFMPILFLCTIVLAGPAWCSHLCYMGGWDGLAASARGRAETLSRGWNWLRGGLFAATPAAALAFRFSGVGGFAAGLAAAAFGVLGAGAMAAFSTRTGVMVHCSIVCPLGFAANVLGKINPFRIRIGDGCTECGRCISTCRYSALDPQRIKRRRPGYTCTLCGDCLGSCGYDALSYSFPGLEARAARSAFLTLVVALHAVFLGVARI